MPRYIAEPNERYPDWDLNPYDKEWGPDYAIEISESEYLHFCRIQREYEAWQRRIDAIVDENVAKRTKSNESA